MSRANMILRQKNLPYIALTETGGLGNCLYLALVDQLLHNEMVKSSILQRASDIDLNHVAVRAAINQFMYSLDINTTWFVKDWLKLEEIREREKPLQNRRDRLQIWRDHLEKMGTVGEWADETVIKSAALYFGKDIFVISETYDVTFDGSYPDQMPVGPPPMTVVHMDGCHFQSVHMNLDLSGVGPTTSRLRPRPDKRTHETWSDSRVGFSKKVCADKAVEDKCRGCHKTFTRLLGHLRRSGKNTCAKHYDLDILEKRRRETHLAQMRKSKAQIRASQTEEEREVRLQQKRDSDSHRRASQSDEDREVHLQQMRESVAMHRSERSAEEINADLELDRERHELAKKAKYQHWDRAAFNYDATKVYHQTVREFVGTMTVECAYGCGALKFKREAKGMCCSNGRLTTDRLPKPPPEPLLSLFEGKSQESKEFLRNPRQYNAAFAMTSFGAQIVTYSGWNPQFKIHGQVTHRIGPMYPSGDQQPQYLQVYFMGDIEDEAERHNQIISATKKDITDKIHQVLLEVNPYISSFKTAAEMVPDGVDYKIVIDADQRGAPNIRKGRLNAPTADEIAIIIADGDLGNHRDIVLEPREGGLKPISETHRR